jgi:hypothetical protein
MTEYDGITCSICSICSKPFSEEEWLDRHTDPRNGEDCHAKCCPMCKYEKQKAERKAKREEGKMPLYASKIDKNHKAIRNAARKAGYIWFDLFRCGGGIPDALVLSKAEDSHWVTFEIKTPGKGFTPMEFWFLNQLPSETPHYTITSINDFFAAMNLEDKE